jgi:hypothetical protein
MSPFELDVEVDQHKQRDGAPEYPGLGTDKSNRPSVAGSLQLERSAVDHGLANGNAKPACSVVGGRLPD